MSNYNNTVKYINIMGSGCSFLAIHNKYSNHFEVALGKMKYEPEHSSKKKIHLPKLGDYFKIHIFSIALI